MNNNQKMIERIPMKQIQFEVLQAGQPRPYADTILRLRGTFTRTIDYGPRKGELTPLEIDESRAIMAARSVFVFKTKDEKPEWHETKLSEITQISKGVYELTITTEFTD